MRSLVIALVLVTACSKPDDRGTRAGSAGSAIAAVGSGSANAPTGATDRDSIIATMHHYDELVLAMDSAGIAALFTADGTISNGGNVMATTPPGIAAFLQSFDGKVKVEATHSTVDHVAIDGDVAHVDGTYAQTARIVEGDRPIKVAGSFIAEWRRTEAGWRIRTMETRPST